MKNKPVLIGIGNIQQKTNFYELDEALILMDKATKLAINDSSPAITKYIDEIRIPKGFWTYRDPGKWIAKYNNFKKRPITYVSKIGILQQSLINEAIKKIQEGEIKASLIIGGEARYKMIQALKNNLEFHETKLVNNPDFYLKADSELHLKEEVNALGYMAVGYYAMIENAARNFHNIDINEHKKELSQLYSEFSKLASKNTNAWSNKTYSAKTIATVSKDNTYQAFPYNKLHCTSWNVNQASALILCNEDIADKLNIPQNKRIYPLISSENNHMIPLLQRSNFYQPLGMQLAANAILDFLKINNLHIDLFDLYSCFPIAIKMFARSLGITTNHTNTITGGMSFAGGPLNHYLLNSTAQMAQKLRNTNNSIGLITGVSGVMSKQSFSLWSKQKLIDFSHIDISEDSKLLDRPVAISKKSYGIATIISYTVILKRNNQKQVIIYADDEDKKRIVLTSCDSVLVKKMESDDLIGSNIKFKDNKVI